MKPYAASIPFGQGPSRRFGFLPLRPESLEGAMWEIERMQARGIPARLVVVRVG